MSGIREPSGGSTLPEQEWKGLRDNGKLYEQEKRGPSIGGRLLEQEWSGLSDGGGLHEQEWRGSRDRGRLLGEECKEASTKSGLHRHNCVLTSDIISSVGESDCCCKSLNRSRHSKRRQKRINLNII